MLDARRALRGALIAAAGICLVGPALGQYTFSSGETDYGRHVESLLTSDLPDPELLKAQALSELAGELWIGSAAALNALDGCLAEATAGTADLVQCVNTETTASLASATLATGIDAYCSYQAESPKQPSAYAGCLLQSWDDISGRALDLHDVVEQFTACSFPDLIRVRELHLERSRIYLEQIIPLDALVGEVAARHQALAYYDTLNPEWAVEKYRQATSGLNEALERARKFNDTLADDPPPAEISTLLTISTAQQNFNWCHNRHPERAKEWEETFAAYAEGSPASIPTWVNAVPTVANARPIDVKGAARRTFEAMTRAHQPRAAQPGSASSQTKIEPPTRNYTYEQCKATRVDAVGEQRLLEKQAARLATLTSSVWEGCRATFLQGAASGINPDATLGASEYATRETERIARKQLRASALSYLVIGLEGISSGLLASQACRAQNERPMENPVAVTPNIDGKGDTRSQVLPEMPPQVSIQQMHDLIIKTSERITHARQDLTDHCLTKPP